MASIMSCNIKWETRLCKVKDRYGYFHTWEQYSQPVGESLVVGGPPAGVIAQVFGIVEFEDGVERVEPYQIKFLDCDLSKENNDNGTGEKV